MSALREAVKAVLESDLFDCLGTQARTQEAIDAVVSAVERVPVRVTIRDLDMSDSENIIVVDGDGLLTVSGAARSAYDTGSYLNIAVDSGDLKLKVGNGTWCPPIQTEVYGR